MWANALLALSNAYALVPFVLLMTAGEKPEALIVFASMTASFSFHAVEKDLHNLPGIKQIAPFDELSLLYWDRVLAVTLGVFMAYRLWRKGFPYFPWLAVLAACTTVVSEFGKYGILTGDTAIWWNRTVYPILHSIWHVLIFMSAERAVRAKGRKKL